MDHTEKKKIKELPRKEKGLLLGAVVVGLLAVLVLVLGIRALTGAAADGKLFHFNAPLIEMKVKASRLKDDLKTLAADVKEQNLEQAAEDTVRVQEDTDALRATMEAPLFRRAEKLPAVREMLDDARSALDLVDEACDTVVTPLLEQLKAYPLSGLAVDGGFNVRLILQYLDYLPRLMPQVEELAAELKTLDLGFLDRENKIASYSESFAPLLSMYHEYEPLLPVVRSLLGEGGDRLYVFGAQNIAEIRASGGFPGAVGSVRIRDGVLTVGDFTSVYNVFTAFTPLYAGSMYISEAETQIYNDQLMAPRDACYCPDFRRVGHVWALAYGEMNGCYVDGCISMTPTVVQKLLAFLGSITLSDGTVLDGTNATKVLQHDIYDDYLTRDGAKWEGHTYEKLDELWVEAAKGTMKLMTSQFSLSHIADYISVIEEGTADRTIMFWMADPQEQAMIESLGWDGGLGSDPTHPQVGVYYSLTDACKLGWYVDLDVELGEPRKNADGSSTYEVTVTITDLLDDDTLYNADWYIVGSCGGDLAGNLHLFAPAGGTIDNVWDNYGYFYNYGTDAGLGVAYAQRFLVYRSDPMVVHFEVTTSPDATEQLTVSRTATLTEYR